jgi:hypothetical protein
MSACSDHWEYLSALADGEFDRVPADTVAHVGGCPECSREVETQRHLTRTLVEAVRREQTMEPAKQHRFRRRWAAAASAVLVLALLGGGFGWRTLTGEDQVAAAVSVASQSPQLRSSDSAAIQTWCEREAERPVPAVSSAANEPVGARMDRSGTTEIVTVTYVTEQHQVVRVSWLDARPASTADSSIQTRSVSGHTVLLVTSRAGSAVVSGDAPLGSLWDVAAQIQAASAPRPKTEPSQGGG